ncbi:hypothetical protein ACVW0J_000773 [Bradyrhizobium sp. i1.7.7]
MVLADQLPHQAVAEILEIVQPVTQIGIGGAQHPRAGVGLHALDGGFRREAGGDRLMQLVRPALVVGEHAVGFQHLAVLAALGNVATLQHAVEIGAQLGERGVEPLDLLRQILGDVVLDDDARLVQHDMAERDAFREDGADLLRRMARGRLLARLGQRRQFAGGDQLRQHHRGGLERLELLLDIIALGAVLHHQHAERVAGAQDRHAEEGVIDFFAGLRAEREGRVALRVAEIERGRLAGDEADQALMGAQHGVVHRLAVEAFGGVELERVVNAQHIDRAHLGHHIGGDQHHDLVQPLLGRDLLRHGFAEPSQQDAGTSRRAPHEPSISSVCLARRYRPAAGPKFQKNNQIVRPAQAQTQIYSRFSACTESAPPELGHSLRQPPPCSPYSELRLVLPSKTPAKREGVYTFAFAATAKRKFV